MKKLLPWLLVAVSIGFAVSSSAAESEAIKSIRFASDASYPPFEYVSEAGTIEGFDISIAKALCQEIKAECVFNNQPWDTLIPSLKMGKYDALISAMGITNERQEQVLFTEPYYHPSASFVAHKTGDLSLDPESMKGKVVGVQIGTTLFDYIQQTYGDTVRIKTYLSQQSAMLDLQARRVDIVFGDTPLVRDWLAQDDRQQSFVIVGKPVVDPKTLGAGFGIALKKNNQALANALNQAITTIKANGELKKIYAQYNIPYNL